MWTKCYGSSGKRGPDTECQSEGHGKGHSMENVPCMVGGTNS